MTPGEVLIYEEQPDIRTLTLSGDVLNCEKPAKHRERIEDPMADERHNDTTSTVNDPQPAAESWLPDANGIGKPKGLIGQTGFPPSEMLVQKRDKILTSDERERKARDVVSYFLREFPEFVDVLAGEILAKSSLTNRSR